MASDGPAGNKDAPVTLQTGAPKTVDTPNPSAANVVVSGAMPQATEEAQQKSAQPASMGSATAANVNAPTPAVSSTFASVQEIAKSQFTALNMNPKAILGEGSFKRILQLSSEFAVGVARETGTKSLAMLTKECQYLKFLSQAELPAIAIHGDVFDINGKEKYAVLMEAIPKHTFVDAKDPKTIKTILPSVLLGVDIPPGEAWFFKKDQIEKNITQNLSQPAALELAKNKAAFLYKQLEDIRAKLEKHKIIIVDLQLLIDPNGVVKIIDPLEIMKLSPKADSYLTLDGGAVEQNASFNRSIRDTRQMLLEMIRFCQVVSTTSDIKKLKSLITPLLDTGSAAALDGERPASSAGISNLPSRYFSGVDSKAGGSRLGAIAEYGDPDAAPKAPKSLSSAPTTRGGGYKPSSRAGGGLVFSRMPAPIPLPASTTASATPATPVADPNASSQSAAAKESDVKPPTPPDKNKGSSPASLH
jgi:hypothetical protein